MITKVGKTTAIMPRYTRVSNATMKGFDPRSAPLKHHLDYLLNLGKVQATRVVATLSDGGVQGHANHDDTVDMEYLPISMGYCDCYKRYMHSLDYKVRCKPNGAIVVDGIVDGLPSDYGYVSLGTYYSTWKRNYPQLKVSCPAEDICNYCFVFANRHRHLANHWTAGATTGTMPVETTTETTTMTETMGVTTTADEEDNDGDVATMETGVTTTAADQPESAATVVEEAREQLLLDAAVHIRMARAQRALYQARVAEAVCDATDGKEHSVRRYTFVVDYGQNMQICTS
jgi:hypothetical protein